MQILAELRMALKVSVGPAKAFVVGVGPPATRMGLDRYELVHQLFE